MAFAPVSFLTTEGLPKFLSMVYHRIIENALYAFVELELADLMVDATPDRGLTIEEILSKDRSNWNSDILWRILRCCADGGIIAIVNNGKGFLLTESGKMLVSNHPSHARDLIRWYLSPLIGKSVDQAVGVVRGQCTGTALEQITGGLDIYTFLHQPNQKNLLTKFNGAMTALSLQAGDSLVTNSDFDRFPTLVDVGGNCGTFLAQILEHYSFIQRGIVFDQPSVITAVDNGDEFRSRMIAQDRYSFVAGNMFESSTIPSADAYILKHILHNYDNEKVVAILTSIRKAFNQGSVSSSTLFIVESILTPEESIADWQIHAMDLMMVASFIKAQVRTLEEHEILLSTAGFKIKRFYPIQAPNSIIEAVPI